MAYRDLTKITPEYFTKEYRDSVIERLIAGRKIMPNGCWEWTGSRRGQMRYGQITAFGSQTTTHRASWMAFNGPLPMRVYVLHRCDNPPCFNPECLFTGTAGENMRDMIAKGRVDRKGDNAPHVKLSSEQVIHIRELIKTGVPQNSIADRYGVGHSTIWNIHKGHTWSHVSESSLGPSADPIRCSQSTQADSL